MGYILLTQHTKALLQEGYMNLARRLAFDDVERLFALPSWQLAGNILMSEWRPFHFSVL